MHKRPHFSLIDLQEAYQIIGLTLADFDETYPQQTHVMETFLKRFEHYPASAVAVVHYDRGLLITLSPPNERYHVPIPDKRKDCLSAIARIVNLTQYQDVENITHVISNFYKEAKLHRLLRSSHLTR